jgi:hypothetical protein
MGRGILENLSEGDRIRADVGDGVIAGSLPTAVFVPAGKIWLARPVMAAAGL